MSAQEVTHVNRLIYEKSPYLLQHAHNPVDWYPWGPEVLERAGREDKPIFLSIGYSTCHWCHVMERESFEREDVARILNDNFLAVKVDREERPEIDEMYMIATQLMTGRGGWPNSVWLTPDGRPWYAGTYFPREDGRGMPGLKTILKQLAEIWRTERIEVEAMAETLADEMRRAADPAYASAAPLKGDIVEGALEYLKSTFDNRFGGFGTAPKFPPHGALALLFYRYRRTKSQPLLDMASKTLDGMARGGIRDHLGGGFHRYSTDGRWFLPHFEKMLYDNAQLARSYSEGFVLTGNEIYRLVAVEAYEWMLREMSDPDGGFYGAVDADSDGQEGKFYVWTWEEIMEALGGDDAELFARVYGVEKDGNFRDEATGKQTGANVLYLATSVDEMARSEGFPADKLRERIEAARAKLLARRERRPRPAIDDKVISGWNGLAIGSLAFAGRTLPDLRYTRAAAQAANFVLSKMRRDGTGLYRSYREGKAGIPGYLDDYAFMADGLVELFETTGDGHWLAEARGLADYMLDKFSDPQGPDFFYTSNDHEDLLVRGKDIFDKAIPSGTGAAARVLARLARATAEERYGAAARTTLEAMADVMKTAPSATESLVLAASMLLDDGAKAERAADSGAAKGKPAGDGDSHSRPPRRSRATATLPSTKEAVSAHTTVEGFRTRAGVTLRVPVKLTIKEGFHVNSHKPLQENIVPTTLTLRENGRAVILDVIYPEGRKITLGSSDEAISVYDGSTMMAAYISILPDTPVGPLRLEFEATLQACDDQQCLEPATIKVPVTVEVRGTGEFELTDQE